MFSGNLLASLQSTLTEIESAGLYKRERLIDSPQNATVRLKDGRTVINMCANNYLGLADHPEVLAAAKAALDRWGFGMASVRFICGTQTLHKQLEDQDLRIPRHRGHDPVSRPASMPTAACSKFC